MESDSNVAAFHAEGGPTGTLRPIYHYNALAMSRLLPPGRILVDLGCGSGQYLLYLAQRRLDIRIIGFDSESMIRAGNRLLEEAGLKPRVTLCLDDITEFYHQIPEAVSLISSVFSLHHLQTYAFLT